MKLQVSRISDDGKETLGKGKVFDEQGNEIFSFDSLELPWKDNQHEISCIPVGIYKVLKVSGSGNIPYEHFAIQDVPDRSGVCIHIGNYASGKRVDTEGCILVGSGFADLNGDGELDIKTSKVTLDKLLELLPGSFELEILSIPNT